MKNLLSFSVFVLCLLFIFPSKTFAQRKKNTTKEEIKNPLDELKISGLKFRCVGPAFTSGRISDFAVNPDNPFEYYIATSSGGVWKTINAGTTYDPIFDGEGSYSIGCITLDPNNSNVVWVGTGENNNQRSVAYGDGIYKSINGGASWTHMGLKNSEHIGKIIVHPENSDIVWVAAIGPLWNTGGDRGLYKTTDGGKTWNLTLEIDKYTGVTDLVIDPSNPDVLYAAAMQRARHVFTYLGGGPGSGIYKSIDGGESWNEVNNGLPSVDLGRIGLTIPPSNPNIIYATVEAAQGKSGFFKSTNHGASWEKQSGYVTSGNYYQEIIADPVDENTIYAMDTWMHVSRDGGKTFKVAGEDTKHVDNHCIWVNPQNNNHWLVGCDGGIYETFDAAKTWDFKANLPVTQFYKVAVDNDKPFYNIYGGTQDNFSIGGPSRTNTDHGIVNSDWFITHGGDGFESQVDPENPNIVYAQSQYGVLVRFDKMSGEEVGIQPKERKDENGYRWNWDAPLQVSNHKSGRLYFAANKVFRSDDYGNSWEVISDDLTKQVNRNELKIMDKVWGIDAVAKNRSTSPYGTIVAFSESPINKDLLVVGTDDGLIQITEDGGNNWKKIENIPGAPTQSYINSVYCSQHDENTIYAAVNHHKYGDFKPYLFKSTNKGVSWNKISNNLPERGSVYAIEEDHENANLIFCGTEFGVFFSPNGGSHWLQMKNGLPTIAVRDIAIQRDENDLVLGTFGRGFYVLDDYSALRSIDNNGLGEEAQIFAIRDALIYEKAKPLGLPGKSFQGDSFYAGEDLGPVAMINYYINDEYKSLKDKRRKEESEASKDAKDNPYPSYEELKAEQEEKKTKLLFTITDKNGKIVRKITKGYSQGMQQLKWDMRYASKEPIDLSSPSFYNAFAGKTEGTLVNPGEYTLSLSKVEGDKVTSLTEPVSFNIVPLNNTVMPTDDRAAKVAFQREVAELGRSIEGAGHLIDEVSNKLKHIKKAMNLVETPLGDMIADYAKIENGLRDIRTKLYGDNIKSTLDIDQKVTPANRVGWIQYEQKYSTSAPTMTHQNSLAIAKEEFAPILIELQKLVNEDLEALENKLEEADAPYTPGRAIKMMGGN